MQTNEESVRIPPSLTFIKSRYRTERELGRGGIGIVYLAHDTQLHNRPVVIKVLRDLYASEWLSKKFRQEIEALVRIDHPGVVGVFDAGELPDGQLYVVMQYVEGVTLRSVMKAGFIELKRLAGIIDQVGRALAAAHENGVLHCDLKPDNIMLQTSRSGEEIVKLIDFGIAKIRNSEVTSKEPTKIAGTIEYMAPEQFNGESTASSDIFSFGVIVYEMVTGVKPFAAGNVFQVMEAFREGLKTGPAEIRADLPVRSDQMIRKALSIDPKERYQKVREFTDPLANSLTESTDFPSTIAVSQTEIQPKKTSSRIIVLSVILLALILAAIFWAARVQKVVPNTKVVVPTPHPISLAYSIEVQRHSDGNKYGEPFLSETETKFEKDDRIRLKIQNADPGFYYILGEVVDDAEPYNVMFPLESESAQFNPSNELTIPRTSFQLGEEQGTERLWLIFSRKAVPLLESVKRFGNAKDRGIIRDHSESAAISDLLRKYSKASDESKKKQQTVLKSSDEVLAHLVVLEYGQ